MQRLVFFRAFICLFYSFFPPNCLRLKRCLLLHIGKTLNSDEVGKVEIRNILEHSLFHKD